jgi:enterochelin esterase-like enzyme
MIEWTQFTADSIKDFPMGDNPTRRFPVYLPPDYHANKSQPYPLIVMLSGYGSISAKFIYETSVFEPSLVMQLDQAIESGELPPLIMAFPDGRSKLGCSQYVNSPVLGNYTDYFCSDLITHLSHHFHIHNQAAGRAVMGHSSGGFGAMIFGMLRPDAYGHIHSSAGDSFYELLYPPTITSTINAIETHGSITAFVEWFLNHPNPGATGCFDAMMALAMCACYAPNPKVKTIMGDLFFDIKTGAIIDAVWQKFLQWDPVRMVEQHIPALAQLSSIHLDCGLQDPYGMQWGHRQIATKLKNADISVNINEYPGKHGGHSWRNIERIKILEQCMQKALAS